MVLFSLRLQTVGDAPERSAVDRGRPVHRQRALMLLGYIPLVTAEAIFRVTLIELEHHPVPGHLGHDRRGGDGCGDPVALPHRQVWRGQAFDREAVGQEAPRAGWAAPRHGAAA